jgi:hypothetical protein
LHLAIRTSIGLALGFVLAMAGLFAGWMLFLFASPRVVTAQLAMLIVGGGAGAGAATAAAWLRMEDNSRHVVLRSLALGIAAGTAGAFGAYRYVTFGREVFIEVDRIAVIGRPDLNPVFLMVLGATVVANVAALAFGLLGVVRRQ